MAVRIKRLLTKQWTVGPAAQQFPDMIKELREVFGNPESRFLIAEDASTPQKIIGCGGFLRVDAVTCEIRRLVVFWGNQRRGVGRQLLTFLIREAQTLGYVRMRVQVPTLVPVLKTFFARHGFREIAPFSDSVPAECWFGELDLSQVILIPAEVRSASTH